MHTQAIARPRGLTSIFTMVLAGAAAVLSVIAITTDDVTPAPAVAPATAAQPSNQQASPSSARDIDRASTSCRVYRGAQLPCRW
jgi:hypothetical protein